MKQIEISGCELQPIRIIADHRGAVLQMIRNDSPSFTHFGEIYFSEVLPGAVKAWKRHFRQTQMLAVPIGRIKIVIYDDRIQSPTYGATCVVELGRPDRYYRLKLPPLVWYGFTCISDSPGLMANCADLPHDPSESETRPPNDGPIKYIW
jgi:dTDP-4-dehydrorhamnose 3,5-epimerase